MGKLPTKRKSPEVVRKWSDELKNNPFSNSILTKPLSFEMLKCCKFVRQEMILESSPFADVAKMALRLFCKENLWRFDPSHRLTGKR